MTEDKRYNIPKEDHGFTDEQINNTIESNDIYKRVKDMILKAQMNQVGYGLKKYPEPLNANTWTIVETIDHIIEESIDKLHYLTMLRYKMMLEGEEDISETLLYGDGLLQKARKEIPVEISEKFHDSNINIKRGIIRIGHHDSTIGSYIREGMGNGIEGTIGLSPRVKDDISKSMCDGSPVMNMINRSDDVHRMISESIRNSIKGEIKNEKN